jgi:hypothetical protein
MELKVKRAFIADAIDIGSADAKDELAIVLSAQELGIALVIFLNDETCESMAKSINEELHAMRLRRASRLAETARQGQS